MYVILGVSKGTAAAVIWHWYTERRQYNAHYRVQRKNQKWSTKLTSNIALSTDVVIICLFVDRNKETIAILMCPSFKKALNLDAFTQFPQGYIVVNGKVARYVNLLTKFFFFFFWSLTILWGIIRKHKRMTATKANPANNRYGLEFMRPLGRVQKFPLSHKSLKVNWNNILLQFYLCSLINEVVHFVSLPAFLTEHNDKINHCSFFNATCPCISWQHLAYHLSATIWLGRENHLKKNWSDGEFFTVYNIN